MLLITLLLLLLLRKDKYACFMFSHNRSFIKSTWRKTLISLNLVAVQEMWNNLMILCISMPIFAFIFIQFYYNLYITVIGMQIANTAASVSLFCSFVWKVFKRDCKCDFSLWFHLHYPHVTLGLFVSCG